MTRVGGAATPRRRAGAGAAALALLSFAALAPATAETEFTPGSGSAAASVFTFNIPYSGANIGMTIGGANAKYFERNATASAQLVDPRFLKLGNLLKYCGGEFPVNLPEPTKADTNASGGKPDEHVTNPSRGGTGAGTESAAAYPGSRGVAETHGVDVGLGGLVQVTGGIARSEATLEPDRQTRTTTGTARMEHVSLLDGLVQLHGIDFYLQQVVKGADDRTHEPAHTAAFRVGRATLAGIPLATDTPEQLASAVAVINRVTGRMGVELRLPRMVPNGPQGFVYTPLTVALGGDTAYGKVLYPFIAGTNDYSVVTLFLKITQPTIFDPSHCEQLGGVFKIDDRLNFTWNYFGATTPVLISAFAAAINGGAEVDLEFGGVRTTIDNTYYPPRVSPARPIVRRVVPTVAPKVVAPAPVPPETRPAPAPPTRVIAPRVRTTTSQCDTTSPVGRPGCWKGAAPIAAALAGSLTLGLLVTDEIVRRRRLALVAARKDGLG